MYHRSSQLPDSKTVLSTTLWRVVGVVPGGAQKSSGGWCEGSNPPQGVPGDHSWLTLGGSMTWWADSTMEHACATFACERNQRRPKLLVLNITMKLVSKREFPFFSCFFGVFFNTLSGSLLGLFVVPLGSLLGSLLHSFFQ